MVDIVVSPGNDITVEVDSASGVDIDSCAAITRAIESVFDREVEDYSLEVGSAGPASPMRVRGQYDKNVGNDVEILTRDGRKTSRHPCRSGPGEISDTEVEFTIETIVKVKEPGAKRPVIKVETTRLNLMIVNT